MGWYWHLYICNSFSQKTPQESITIWDLTSEYRMIVHRPWEKKPTQPTWPEVGEANTQPTSAGEAAGGSHWMWGQWQIPTIIWRCICYWTWGFFQLRLSHVSFAVVWACWSVCYCIKPNLYFLLGSWRVCMVPCELCSLFASSGCVCLDLTRDFAERRILLLLANFLPQALSTLQPLKTTCLDLLRPSCLYRVKNDEQCCETFPVMASSDASLAWWACWPSRSVSDAAGRQLGDTRVYWCRHRAGAFLLAAVWWWWCVKVLHHSRFQQMNDPPI